MRKFIIPATYVDLAVFETEFQVIVDGLVGDFAEQGKVGNTDLLFLRGLEYGLLHLRLPTSLPPIAHIGGL